MKNPKINKLFLFAAYGCAGAIGYFNVKMSAIGLATDPAAIQGADWVLAVGMLAFESCLSGSIGTPAFWPVMVGSATNAIDKILDLAEDNPKYQYAGIAIMISFVVGLMFATWQVYTLDLYSTRLAVYPKEGEPTKGQVFKVYGLVYGPECLLLGAGLLQLASGISDIQFRQVSRRSAAMADSYGPNL